MQSDIDAPGNKLNHAAGMLAPQICMRASNYKFAVWEDGTTIYKNGVEMATIDRGERDGKHFGRG